MEKKMMEKKCTKQFEGKPRKKFKNRNGGAWLFVKEFNL